MNKNNLLPVIYEYKNTSKHISDKNINNSNFNRKHFRINKVTIYKNKKYTIEFNDYFNEICNESIIEYPFSKSEIIQMIKFCFTGKNETNGHLMNKGIKYIETAFSINHVRYNIRIFSEHSYKTFLTKTTKFNEDSNSQAEQVLVSCNSLKDYHEKISPYLKQMFNLPDDISFPQYMRLFFLGDENSLFRIISDKEYSKMTTTLMDYLINELVIKCKQNPDIFINIDSKNNKEFSYSDYMINFIEDKISKLKNRERLEIDEIKNHYKKETNKNVNKKISEIKKEINKLKEEEIKLKKYLKNIERILNPKEDFNENQLLLFNDKDSNIEDEKVNLQDKMKETKSYINKINLKINYLNPILQELIREKKSIAKKYHQKIDDIITEYQERMLQEKINLEEIIEIRKKSLNKLQLNINNSTKIKNKIIELLIKNINYYIKKLKLEYEIAFDGNYIPVFINNKISKYFDDFDKTRQMLFSFSFHLGLIEFFNVSNEVLPNFLLINFSKEYSSTFNEIQNIISEFYHNRKTGNNFQIITMYPLISKFTNK